MHRDLASSAGHKFEPHFEHFFYKKLFSRASYYKHVSLDPQDLDRSLGRHVRLNTETRQPIRPKDPAVPRGGECYKAYPGLGNWSIFYPGSSVGSTITLGGEIRGKLYTYSFIVRRIRKTRTRFKKNNGNSIIISSNAAKALFFLFLAPSRPTRGSSETVYCVCTETKWAGQQWLLWWVVEW